MVVEKTAWIARTAPPLGHPPRTSVYNISNDLCTTYVVLNQVYMLLLRGSLEMYCA